MIDIKTNIVQALKDQGRTQRDLASALEVTTQTLQYYFSGNITLRNIERIAAALEVEPWRLLKPSEPGEAIPTIPKAETPTQEEPTTTTAICPNCGKALKITIQ